MPKVLDLAQAVAIRGLVGLCGGIDGKAELAMIDSHRAAVVDVVVRNEDGPHVADIPAMTSQPLLGSTSTDPRIEQQFDAIGLDVKAIAVAAGLEGDDVHRPIVLRPRGA